MNLFDDILEKNKNTINDVEKVLAKLSIMKDNNLIYNFNNKNNNMFSKLLHKIESNLKSDYSSVFVYNKQEPMFFNNNLNNSFLIHKYIYIDFSLKNFNFILEYNFHENYDFSLSKFFFKEKNGLTYIIIDKNSISIKLVNEDTCYDTYTLKHNKGFFDGGTNRDFTFEDDFGTNYEEINELSSFLKFCFKDNLIDSYYLNEIFINNIIFKRNFSQEIKDFFIINYDKSLEDYSSFFSFDLNEKINFSNNKKNILNILKNKLFLK